MDWTLPFESGKNGRREVRYKTLHSLLSWHHYADAYQSDPLLGFFGRLVYHLCLLRPPLYSIWVLHLVGIALDSLKKTSESRMNGHVLRGGNISEGLLTLAGIALAWISLTTTRRTAHENVQLFWTVPPSNLQLLMPRERLYSCNMGRIQNGWIDHSSSAEFMDGFKKERRQK